MSWPLVKLGDICTFVNGDRGKNYPSSSEFVEEGIPFINAGDLIDNQIDKKRLSYISSDKFDLLSSGKVCKDDLLFCLRGSLGKFAIVDDITEGAIASSLVIIRAGNKITTKYLFEYLRSSLCENEITKFANGAAQPNLSGKDLKDFQIPLPSLEEQKRVAAILDKADSLRRKNQQAIQLADQFLRAVFFDMFGDPVTNPKGWEAIKLGHICDVGSSKRVFVNEFTDTGIPFYRGTEVGKLGESEDIQPHLFISNEHYENLKNHSGVPEIGDLLMPSICHDGRIWKVDHKAPFYFKDGRVLWIKVNQSSINSDYLICYLKYLFLTNYSSIASGTTFAELKIVNLKDVSVLTPPLDLQIKFSEITTKVIKNNDVIKFSIGKSDEMFSALSQKAFAGEL